jgi:hypothetical protein
MGHKQKQCLKVQARERFDKLTCFGRSKNEDKKDAGREFDQLVRRGEAPAMTKQEYINNAIRDKIYSINTYGTYAKHNNYFWEYCEKEHGCKTLEQCKQYVDEWLQKRIDAGLSAYTISMEKAALCKVYQVDASAFIDTPERARGNITRSRGAAVRDTGFSLTNNAEIINFCRGTGLRRFELAKLESKDLRFDENNQPYLIVRGKGGRYREAPVVGPHKDEIVAKIQASDGKVWDKIPSHMDVHGYRADYATAIYTAYARDPEELQGQKWYNPKTRKMENATYHCRSDRKGVAFDKAAMIKASEALGHGRLDVVAGHYIR